VTTPEPPGEPRGAGRTGCGVLPCAEVSAARQVTDGERALLRKRGFVSVDQAKPYSMASSYDTV